MSRATHLAMLLACLALTACAVGTGPGRPAPGTPVGSWSVEVIESHAVLPYGQLQLTFDDVGDIYADTGVNVLRGSWSLEGSTLRLTPMRTTRRAGPEELMEQERLLLDALDRVDCLSCTDDELVLLSEDGEELLRLRRCDVH